MKSLPLALPLFALPLLAACSSSTAGAPEDASGDEVSEVRVAKCPATLALRFGKPKVFKRTPAPFGGGAFSPAEKARVESVMQETRQLESIDANLTLDRTTTGKCFYKGAGAERATFRTQNGKDLLQIFEPNGLQVFAFPSSYDVGGLVFPKNASATLMANVAASGPFSDGATRSVKIGQAPLASGRTDDAVVLGSGTNDPILDGPESIRFVAKAADVTAFVASSFLATCTVTKEASSATETRFAIAIEYDLDDGFNGCTIEFSNDAGYRADIDVGLFIDD
jgi:hypothetical protein